MLFADGTTGITSGELWSGVAIVITAIGTAAAAIWGKVSTSARTKRADTISEWQDIVDAKDKERDDLRGQIGGANSEILKLREQLHKLRDTFHAEMVAALAMHAKDIKELQVAHARCEKENAELRGEIRVLRAHLKLPDMPASSAAGKVELQPGESVKVKAADGDGESHQ